MRESVLRRAIRRAGREVSAVREAVAFGRAADGVVAAGAMFAAGMAHATPARWGSRALHGLGVERLRLRPRRLDGYEVAVNPSDGGHTCVIAEFFVPPVACDLSLVPFEPAVIIDAGAHIGLFTLLARRRFPSAAIIAFEPNPDNLPWLRENLRMNGVSGVDVIPAAVWTSPGRAAFQFTSGQSESGRLIEPGGGPIGSPDGIEVTLVDLPALLRLLAPASLLLKLDIEGAEERLIPEVVPALPRRSAVFFETHRGSAGWEGVRRALEAEAFAVRLIEERDVFRDGFAVRV